MATYPLYLESGPQRKTTVAHALSLPGAISFAPTTDEAIAQAPEAIRAYLRYLRRHGERVDLDADIRTPIAQHVTEGGFIGTMLFTPDLEAVTPAEVKRWTAWLEWSRADLLGLVAKLDARRLAAKPAKGRRSARSSPTFSTRTARRYTASLAPQRASAIRQTRR